MAHGPCGEEFRAAFSCFVYSKEEPKGMDCIDGFRYAVLIADEPCPLRTIKSDLYMTLETEECADQMQNRGMQDCFRLHPDVYNDELADPEPSEDDEPSIAGAVDAAVNGIAEDVPVSNVPISSNPPLTSSPSSAPEIPRSDSIPRTPPPETLSAPTPRDADVHPAHTTDADDDAAKSARAKKATRQVKREYESDGQEELVPKEWHDARQKNDANESSKY